MEDKTMKWQPIETAPMMQGEWLLGHGDGLNIWDCTFVMEWDDDEGWIEVYSDVCVKPTHWMLLPVAPEARK
jgi:hypothetical protein